MSADMCQRRAGIARSERGLQGDIKIMVSRRARRGIRWPGGGGVCVEALILHRSYETEGLQMILTVLPPLIDQER